MNFNLKRLKSQSGFIAIVFAFTIFVKCVLFHYFCFGYIAVCSLWTAPRVFFEFYITKAFFAVVVAAFVFLSKKPIWTIVFSFVLDVWIIANYIYYRANGLFLNLDMILIAGNLSGFWTSIITYLNWNVFFLLIVSLLYSFLLLLLKAEFERNVITFCSCFALSILMYGADMLLYDGGKVFSYNDLRLRQLKSMAEGKSHASFTHYVESSSILHLFPSMFIFYIERSAYLKDANKNIVFSSREEEIFSKIVKPKNEVNPTTNLCLILVESLESWPMQIKDKNGSDVLPNINKLSKLDNALSVRRIKSQVKYGNSGDGQMIVNTGMLPILSGAACVLYNKQPYPNFAGLYNNSICVNPTSNNVWGQNEMNKCYNYSKYVFPTKGESNDEYVLRKGAEQTKKDPFVVQMITISSHVPFNRVPETSNLHDRMPLELRKYLNCLHYTDSCIGVFLQKIEQDSLLANTTIVITGDHTVFKGSMLREFQPFAEKYNYPIPSEESYCPLIIYSPTIKERTVVDELCYQMDIFPTILHCIGADDYYWKGFGVNLLDSTARHNRQITEDEAYILSDKMIRSDYFRGIGE